MSKTKVWREEDDAKEQQQERKTGTLKFFAEDKKYGFIIQDEGEDVFFHISQSDIEEPEKLESGCRVSYEVTEGDKGLEAVNLTIEKEAPRKKTTKQSNMANNFWDECIKKEEVVVFHFTDDTEIQAIPTGYDNYYIKVAVDGKQQMVYKHALKWVEEAE